MENINIIQNQLIKSSKIIKKFKFEKLFQERNENFLYQFEDLEVDLTRQSINKDILNNLISLCRHLNFEKKKQELFAKEKINFTENNFVLHPFLRTEQYRKSKEFKKLIKFSKLIRSSKNIKKIVNVGIGGSDLGPFMVNDALEDFSDGPEISYVSNIDPMHLEKILRKCDPKATIFIIVSKSFNTIETLTNANLIKEWYKKNNVSFSNYIVAITASPEKSINFGIKKDYIFDFSSGVGGRFSLWSAVGLTIILSIGEKNYLQFLDGAYQIDKHFLETDLTDNIPFLMSLIRIWNRNYLKRNCYAIIPYEQKLEKFPSWLQQLEMESNGKSFFRRKKNLFSKTSPIIFGGIGTNSQHSFFQLLHQGTDIIPVDILFARHSGVYSEIDNWRQSHKILTYSALAQADSLALGKQNKKNKHENFDGNRPSVLLSWGKTHPYELGRLIALYEYITISCGFIWGINSFDQFGVELGKKQTLNLLNEENMQSFTPTTSFHLKNYNNKKK